MRRSTFANVILSKTKVFSAICALSVLLTVGAACGGRYKARHNQGAGDHGRPIDYKLASTIDDGDDEIVAVSFSPNGQRVLTTNDLGISKVWDVETGVRVLTLDMSVDEVGALGGEYSPDGKSIVTWGGIVAVWDALSGLRKHTLQLDSGSESTFAGYTVDGKDIVVFTDRGDAAVYSSDSGKLRHRLGQRNPQLPDVGDDTALPIATRDRSIVVTLNDTNEASDMDPLMLQIWSSRSGKRIGSFALPQGTLPKAIDGGSGHILICDPDGAAAIYDPRSGRKVATLAGSSGLLIGEFSPDGKWLVGIDPKQTSARAWDTSTGQLLSRTAKTDDDLTGFTFASDGARVAVYGDEQIYVWNIEAGTVIAEPSVNKSAPKTGEFSRNGRRLAVVWSDGRTRVFGDGKFTLIARLVGHNDEIYRANFSPDGKFLVTGSDDKSVKVWSTQRGQLRLSLNQHEGDLWDVRFGDNSTRVVSSDSSGKTILWTSTDAKWTANKKPLVLEGHKNRVYSALFLRNSKYIVTASEDRSAKIWLASTGKVIAELAGHEKAIWSVSGSPDGRRVLTVSEDETAKIWEVPSGRLIHTLDGHGGVIDPGQFSSDGKKVLTVGREDGEVRIWNAEDGKLVTTLSYRNKTNALGDKDEPFEDAAGDFRAAAFAPNGDIVATGSEHGAISLWSARDGSILATLGPAHTDEVTWLTYSPDGSMLLSTSEDARAIVWSAQSGKRLMTLAGHQDSIIYGSFSRDGKMIVTSGQDDYALLWRVR